MPSTLSYREQLSHLPAAEWDAYLLAHSGLPGPRGNLELMQAVADAGDEALFARYAAFSHGDDSNDPAAYPVMCGAVGLGRLLAEGSDAHWETLRALANDPRWRVREGVAMALQRVGLTRHADLLAHIAPWCDGAPLEQRAVVAGLCEPSLLRNPLQARATLEIMDAITAGLIAREDRRSEDIRVLRQALGYGWSVAMVGSPELGWQLFERWAANSDPDIRWIVRENLKKKRLERLDAARAAALRATVA